MSQRRNWNRRANRHPLSRSGQNLYPTPFKNMSGIHAAGCSCLSCKLWASRGSPPTANPFKTIANKRYGREHKSSAMIPVENQDKPIRAWKAVMIYAEINMYTGKLELRFHGTGNGNFYTVPYGTMVCDFYTVPYGTKRPNHTKPDVDCYCGFYAMKEPSEVMGSSWICEVELYGTVIVGEADMYTSGGYRAEKQRVLSITPYGRCNRCSIENAAYANTIAINGGILIPVCWACADECDAIVPWDELRNACPVEWRQPFMFRTPMPAQKQQVSVSAYSNNGNSHYLELPAGLRGSFAAGMQNMMHVPILKSQSSYFVFQTFNDQNEDGFRLVIENDGYRIGEWHFQVPKDARS